MLGGAVEESKRAARGEARSSAVIALLLLASELLGHRLGRELRGTGTLSLNRCKCRLVQIRLEPAHAPGRGPPRRTTGFAKSASARTACARSRCTFKIVLGPKKRTYLQSARRILRRASHTKTGAALVLLGRGQRERTSEHCRGKARWFGNLPAQMCTRGCRRKCRRRRQP
jgi:hypothetical protein